MSPSTDDVPIADGALSTDCDDDVVERRSRVSELRYDSSRVSRELWLCVAFIVAWLASYSFIAVCLGALGRLHLLTTAAVALVPAAILTRWLRTFAPPRHRQDGWSSATAIGIAVCSVLVNSRYAGNHVLIDRDPGSYLTTARWLARTGELRAYPANDVLASASDVTYGSSAVFEMSKGVLEFQFNHAPATVYALAFRFAGATGLFAAPAVVGGVALLSFYLVVRGFFSRPFAPLVAVLTLALSLPFSFVARDHYSELFLSATLWFVLAALLALVTTRSRVACARSAVALGFLAGAMSLFRIDAWLYVATVAAVMVLVAIWREDIRRTLPFVGVSMAIPILVGYMDAEVLGGVYVKYHSTEMRALGAAAATVVAVALAIYSIARRSSAVRNRLEDGVQGRAAACVGILAMVLLGLAWVVRPHIEASSGSWAGDSNIGRAVANLQRAAGRAVQPTRGYNELSIVSIGWYFGAVTIVLAIVGVGIAIRAGLVEPNISLRVFLMWALICGPLYLFRPSITPDQPWATRRFIPFVIPATLALAAIGLWILSETIRRGAGNSRLAATTSLCLGAALMIIPTAAVTHRVRSFGHASGSVAAIHDACAEIGDATVVELGDGLLAMPLRAWCGATVGILHPPTQGEQLSRVVEAARSTCTPLFVVSRIAFPPDVEPWIETVSHHESVSERDLVPTLLGPPTEEQESELNIFVGRIGSPTSCGHTHDGENL